MKRTITSASRCLSALAIVAALTACNDDNTIGSSLVEDSVEVEIYTSAAPTGASVENPTIQSRTITQLLGRLDAKGFGKLSSEIVTQFFPASGFPDGLTSETLDSVKLVFEMYSTSVTGDSIVPMGIAVHKLTKALPTPIYSEFDPEGYYDPALFASEVYVPSGVGLESDSLLNSSTRDVTVDLPLQFGKDILDTYASDPSIFATPTAFTQWFPGFYIANSFGSGRVISIARTSVQLFYDGNGFMAMAVTPEVINNSGMTLELSDDLKSKVAAGQQLLVCPVGYDVDLNFPLKELVDHYRASTGKLAVVNSLTFSIPVDFVSNDLGIQPPGYVLMVRKSKKAEFFANNNITDDVWSFIGTYDNTAKAYTFNDMKAYIDAVLTKGSVEADDYEFVVTPVNLLYDSDSYGTSSVTGVSPYVGSPAMCRLRLDKATPQLTFSRQSINQ